MTASAQSPTPEPASVAIRARPPSPKRLSRKILMAGVLGAGAVIAFALMSGLSARPEQSQASAETAVAAVSGPPDSIQQAASTYEAGDLLRQDEEADLTAANADTLAPPADPFWAEAPAAPEAARTDRSTEAAPDPEFLARRSPLLFAARAPGAGAAAPGQDDRARLEARLTPPRSRYEVQAGQVIPAALVTALNGDLPGRVIAQVTAPVYDSVSGEHLLIPQGSRLIGAYQNGAHYGEQRLLLIWNRLILPNGWSINLDGMEAVDGAGAAGLSDRTDNHLDRLAAAVALSSIIGVAANQTEDEGDDLSLSRSLGDAAAQQAVETGARIVERELAVRPTLTVRAGAPVRVLVSRDIALRPYVGARR